MGNSLYKGNNVLKKITQQHCGYTLLELIIVVMIVGILTTFATPMYDRLLAFYRVRDAQEEFMNFLALVRAEAATRNVTLVACPSKDNSCDSKQLDWSGRWIAFYDEDQDQKYSEGSNDILIAVRSEPRNDQGLPFLDSNRRTQILMVPNSSNIMPLETPGLFKFLPSGSLRVDLVDPYVRSFVVRVSAMHRNIKDGLPQDTPYLSRDLTISVGGRIESVCDRLTGGDSISPVCL